MNSNSGGSCDENNPNKVLNEGSRSKVKNFVCRKENIVQQQSVSNGVMCEDDKISPVQNGASCSFSISLSSSLPCTNQKSYLNGECSGEKSFPKGKVLHTEENGSRNVEKKQNGAGFLDSESSSGNEGEEGLSGDDCCIYLYKGDQFADLPNSFFSDDMVVNGHQPLKENHRKANHRREPEDNDGDNLGSSPEMDYLEMDFDPGPSLEQDSEEDLNGLEQRLNNDSPVPELPNELCIDSAEKVESCQNVEPQAGPSSDNLFEPSVKHSRVSDCNSNSFRTKNFLGKCCAGFCSVKENSQSCSTTVENKQLENRVGNNSMTDSLVERLDKKILTENHDLGASVNSKREGESKTCFDEIMLWTEQQAISKQVILVSSEVSCAATAVINAMFVLKMRISIEKVKEGISTKLKAESPSIPQYLVSRSFAGVAHENLIQGIHHASHGLLYARFFQMYPRRDIVLTRWLCHWMKKGAVPIATMNVQKDSSPEEASLDSRHHQMIFGVGEKGIYLTNPLECLQEEELWTRLVSPSVLKIKRSEIMSLWSPETNLNPLMFQSDSRWKEMNVLGQVVNVIREAFYPASKAKFLTPHISIPASSGITLVIPRYCPGYEELVSAADLPLLAESASE